MTGRVMVAALLLGVCCKANGGEAAGVRPKEAGPVRDGVGSVLLSEGEAQVLAAGKSFPAQKGFALDRSDELAVSLGGLLLVRLDNGYVVRVDEDLRLPVRDIVLLDAPAPRESLDDQLARLLTDDERAQLRERIVGFHARVAGAESVGAVRREERAAKAAPPGAPRAAPAAKKVASAPPPAPPPPPAPAPMREVQNERQVAKSALEESAVDELLADSDAADEAPVIAEADAPAVAQKKEQPSFAWSVLHRGGAQKRGDALPAVLADAFAGGLADCLSESVAKLPTRPAALELLVQVRAGRISRVALGKGLPVPRCARGLVGKALAGVELAEASWIAIEVPLR